MRGRLDILTRITLMAALLAACGPEPKAPVLPSPSKPENSVTAPPAASATPPEARKSCQPTDWNLAAIDRYMVGVTSPFAADVQEIIRKNLDTVEKQAEAAFPEAKVEDPFYVTVSNGCSTATHEFAEVDGVLTLVGTNIVRDGAPAELVVSEKPVEITTDGRYVRYSAGGKLIIEVDDVLATTSVVDADGNLQISRQPSFIEKLAALTVTGVAGAAPAEKTEVPVAVASPTALATDTGIDVPAATQKPASGETAAMTAVRAEFSKYQLPIDGITFSTTGKSTIGLDSEGNKVYENDGKGGKFSMTWAAGKVKNVYELIPTDYAPDPNKSNAVQPFFTTRELRENYIRPIFNRVQQVLGEGYFGSNGMGFGAVLLNVGDGKYFWGFAVLETTGANHSSLGGRFLAFEAVIDGVKVDVVIPIIPTVEGEITHYDYRKN